MLLQTGLLADATRALFTANTPTNVRVAVLELNGDSLYDLLSDATSTMAAPLSPSEALLPPGSSGSSVASTSTARSSAKRKEFVVGTFAEKMEGFVFVFVFPRLNHPILHRSCLLILLPTIELKQWRAAKSSTPPPNVRMFQNGRVLVDNASMAVLQSHDDLLVRCFFFFFGFMIRAHIF